GDLSEDAGDDTPGVAVGAEAVAVGDEQGLAIARRDDVDEVGDRADALTRPPIELPRHEHVCLCVAEHAERSGGILAVFRSALAVVGDYLDDVKPLALTEFAEFGLLRLEAFALVGRAGDADIDDRSAAGRVGGHGNLIS